MISCIIFHVINREAIFYYWESRDELVFCDGKKLEFKWSESFNFQSYSIAKIRLTKEINLEYKTEKKLVKYEKTKRNQLTLMDHDGSWYADKKDFLTTVGHEFGMRGFK